jgi:MFS transporter, DHA1 family, tetracycline resistance protein
MPAPPVRPLATLFVICVIDVLGFGIMVPLVPYMADRFGAAPAVITPILGVYSLFQLLANPLLGRFSDRYGRRPILIFSMAGACVSYLILGFATNLGWLLASRVLGGLMAGNLATVFAYASDVSAPRDRARSLGIMGAAIGTGFMLGPALGGVLAGEDEAHANFLLPALVAAMLALVALTLVWRLLPESHGPGERAKQAGVAQHFHPWALLRAKPGLRWLVLGALCVIFAQSTLESIYAIWAMNRFGVGPRTIGLSLFALAVVAVTMQGGLVRMLVPRLGEYRLALAGIIAYALGLLTVGMGGSLAAAIAGMALVGLGVGAFNPSSSSLVAAQADTGNRGAVLGTYQASASLARVIGPLCSGAIYSRIGHSAPYLVAAAVAVQASWCILAARRHPGTVHAP